MRLKGIKTFAVILGLTLGAGCTSSESEKSSTASAPTQTTPAPAAGRLGELEGSLKKRGFYMQEGEVPQTELDQAKEFLGSGLSAMLIRVLKAADGTPLILDKGGISIVRADKDGDIDGVVLGTEDLANAIPDPAAGDGATPAYDGAALQDLGTLNKELRMFLKGASSNIFMLVVATGQHYRLNVVADGFDDGYRELHFPSVKPEQSIIVAFDVSLYETQALSCGTSAMPPGMELTQSYDCPGDTTTGSGTGGYTDSGTGGGTEGSSDYAEGEGDIIGGEDGPTDGGFEPPPPPPPPAQGNIRYFKYCSVSSGNRDDDMDTLESILMTYLPDDYKKKMKEVLDPANTATGGYVLTDCQEDGAFDAVKGVYSIDLRFTLKKKTADGASAYHKLIIKDAEDYFPSKYFVEVPQWGEDEFFE